MAKQWMNRACMGLVLGMSSLSLVGWSWAPHMDLSSDLTKGQILTILKSRMPGSSSGQLSSLSEVIHSLSKKYHIDASLVLSVMETESSFKLKAKSSHHAHGLMQLQPATARFLNSKLKAFDSGGLDLNNPLVNATLGIHYLAYLKNKFGSMRLALAAYNMGPVKLQRRLSVNASFSRSLGASGGYVAKVLEGANHFQSSGMAISVAENRPVEQFFFAMQ